MTHQLVAVVFTVEMWARFGGDPTIIKKFMHCNNVRRLDVYSGYKMRLQYRLDDDCRLSVECAP